MRSGRASRSPRVRPGNPRKRVRNRQFEIRGRHRVGPAGATCALRHTFFRRPVTDLCDGHRGSRRHRRARARARRRSRHPRGVSGSVGDREPRAAARPSHDDVPRRPARSLCPARRVERRRADGGAGDGDRLGVVRGGIVQDRRRPPRPQARGHLRSAGPPRAGRRGRIPIASRGRARGARPAVRAAVLVEEAERVPARSGPDRAAHRRARGAGGLASAAGRSGDARGRGARACRAARGARALAVGGARFTHRIRPRRRSLRAVEVGAEGGDAGGVDRHDRAPDRRIRHRQGSDRALHPSRVGAARRSVRRRELRGAAGAAARVGAVRPRARRVHRRAAGEAGSDRAGRRRRAVPGRSRRDEPVGAGEVPARAAGARVPAPRRQRARSRRTSG